MMRGISLYVHLPPSPALPPSVPPTPSSHYTRLLGPDLGPACPHSDGGLHVMHTLYSFILSTYTPTWDMSAFSCCIYLRSTTPTHSGKIGSSDGA